MKILYLYKTEALRHALIDLIMDSHPFSTYRATHDRVRISINDNLELCIKKMPYNLGILRGLSFDYVYFESIDLTSEEYFMLSSITHFKEGHLKAITGLDRPALNVCVENLK